MDDIDSSPEIVGIAASADDVPALEAFLRGLANGPAAPPALVALFRDGENEGDVIERLGARSPFPVRAVADRERVLPGALNVVRGAATLDRNTIRAADAPPNARRLDVFLGSLADTRGEDAVAVLFSEGNGDGILGIKLVKERAGLALACAGVAGAPFGRVMAELVDLALPAGELGARLADMRRAPRLSATRALPEDLRTELLALLANRSGRDFAALADAALLRRLRRRIAITGDADVAAYLARLRRDDGEASRLVRDLLVPVTGFFRDPAAFEMLERTVIPRLFEERADGAPLRVWVPGCATGEEVYSIAILLEEYAERLPDPPRIQIFATDVDESALPTSRRGFYTLPLLAGVSETRRIRFFEPEEGGLTIARRIRKSCIFSTQNVVRDPPFAHIDLVSCRNLLVHFAHDAQERIVRSLHYALRPGGVLFLGASEALARPAGRFVEDGAPFLLRRLPSSPQEPLASVPASSAPSTADDALRHRAMAQVLAHHAPPHVVVDGRANVLHVSARAGRLLDGSRARLRPALREAFDRAIASPSPGSVEADDGEGGRIRVVLEALEGSAADDPRFILLAEPVFPDGRKPGPFAPTAAPPRAEPPDGAMCEDLQASREELQSLNDELTAINAELSERLNELRRFNADLRNLTESAGVATVFLDAACTIRSFTPAAAAILHLRKGDVGRPLTDLAGPHNHPELARDLEKVLASGAVVERTLEPDGEGTVHLMRLRPYEDRPGPVSGIVVSLLDVTALAHAETQQRILIEELNHRVKNMLALVLGITRITVRSAASPREFADSLLARLRGMAKSYDLLAARSWTGVALAELVRDQTAALHEGRLSIAGPDVRLSSQEALSIGMILHELADNAVRHGALAAEGGRVDVRWTLDDRELCLAWTETGAAPPNLAAEPGLGFRLIENETAGRLEGTLERRLRPEGLEVLLRFAPADPAPVPLPARPEPAAQDPLAASRTSPE